MHLSSMMASGMNMEFPKSAKSEMLKGLESDYGRDGMNRILCAFLSGMTGHNCRGGDVLGQLLPAELHGGFDAETCNAFRNWFCNTDSCGGDTYGEFETLTHSDEFMLLSFCLYEGSFILSPKQNLISVSSSDGVVLRTDKRVAAAESVVLNGFVGDSQDEVVRGLVPSRGGVIPLDFTADVVSEMFHFMKKKHKFSEALKGLVGNYKVWFTEYLKRNRAILPYLHKAAGLLSIPGLLELTTMATREVGGLIGEAFEGVSRWCENLTISQMLSSLTAEVGVEDASDNERSRFLHLFGGGVT